MKRVVVFGATGYTGRLVVAALLNQGVRDVVLGGRDESKLSEQSQAHGGLEYRVADATDSESLQRLTQGAHVVVDTAGPFSRFGEPVVRAALAAGAHFLDTTGEQAYMARIVERYHGPAKGKGLAVVNGQAFEFALGYSAAALLCEWDPGLERVDVFNRTYGFGTTRGTRKSALAQLASEALVRRGGRLVRRGASPLPKWVTWPDTHVREPAVPFPGGEALHLGRAHPEVLDVSTNLAVPSKLALPLMAAWSSRSLVGLAAKAGLVEWLERSIDAGSEGPAEDERKRSGFKVLARGASRGALRAVLVKGNDPYGITGVIAALGAKLLLESPPLMTGVISTDQAFGAQRFLDALAAHGVSVSRHELS
jgi:short subunit dehydrogenase-like uncharacterized protein